MRDKNKLIQEKLGASDFIIMTVGGILRGDNQFQAESGVTGQQANHKRLCSTLTTPEETTRVVFHQVSLLLLRHSSFGMLRSLNFAKEERAGS